MAKNAHQHNRYQLSGTYERLRRDLVESPDDGRLDKPLSYWVQPTDRRLPIAFLDRTLRELLASPLQALMSTPGVGQKKILGFFDLLRRAAKAPQPSTEFGLRQPEEALPARGQEGFDPGAVSEAVWSTWCETVRHCGLEDEKIGRVAPSLRSLPTVIWSTRLSRYSSLSLADIRLLKTHGRKRVQAILEVFCMIHEAVSTAALPDGVDICLTPAFVPTATRWITDTLRQTAPPEPGEIDLQLVKPLVRQVAIDFDGPVAELVAERLQADSRAPSVKQQAETLGVTRARVYQLLDDCGTAMEVRWPEGRWLLPPLAKKLDALDWSAARLVHDTAELFYPSSRVSPAAPSVAETSL